MYPLGACLLVAFADGFIQGSAASKMQLICEDWTRIFRIVSEVHTASCLYDATLLRHHLNQALYTCVVASNSRNETTNFVICSSGCAYSHTYHTKQMDILHQLVGLHVGCSMKAILRLPQVVNCGPCTRFWPCLLLCRRALEAHSLRKPAILSGCATSLSTNCEHNDWCTAIQLNHGPRGCSGIWSLQVRHSGAVVGTAAFWSPCLHDWNWSTYFEAVVGHQRHVHVLNVSSCAFTVGIIEAPTLWYDIKLHESHVWGLS